MSFNIIEIASNNIKLSVERGFIKIEESGEHIKDIPIDYVSVLFVTSYNVIYTNNLLQRLSEENIPLLILGKNFAPSGILLSLVGQSHQCEVQHMQIENKKPLEKRLWQSIIKSKIKNQSNVLDLFDKHNNIKNLADKVLSGDSDNKEAYAAKLYFKSLFGDRFARCDEENHINSFLNYGYAILRSALARYVVSSGLNPSYGIGHHSKINPFCLVDDLIEPFRPLIDALVYKMTLIDGEDTLNKENKNILAHILNIELENGCSNSQLYVILQEYVWDLVRCYRQKETNITVNQHLITEQIWS